MSILHKTDPGLQYLQDIGFTRIQGRYGLHKRWIQIFGDEKANELMEIQTNIRVGEPEFYNFKNSDPEISRAYSEYYDGDIIRKACNYIYDHKEYFGKTILEVGCDTGYITGFLSRTFPNSRIIAIDQCAAGIKLAEDRAKTLNLQNVEFRNCSLADVDGQFDTVFCMRTMQENIADDEPFFGEPIFSQFPQYAKKTHAYTKLLTEHIKKDGYLCVFERIHHDPLMYGWLTKLNDCGCGILPETCKEIPCKEYVEINKLQAFVCHQGKSTDSKVIFNLWAAPLKSVPTFKRPIIGWYGLVYLNDHAGKMVRDVRFYDRDNNEVARYAVFMDRDNPTRIYYLDAAGGSELHLHMGKAADSDKYLQGLQYTVDMCLSYGLRKVEIDSNYKNLEGVIN